ncbi:CCA tRNA nucleotidyltransferase [Paenibacillus sp. OAS669]|uniref:CCA tRNA nucleotidyltransferase n=1 Tax=Paenibacillus sp. OAS669 TaxID=2663821 RepID=UPI0017896347|nr:CCA tRNA nucleotidyltransferase [Paenibacillus sp. OAS669]MBE1445929.1 tRNA nucleotidyltransferase (CCA-adding enzyme) [Paenibacillus sp. OAS669]
MKDSLEQGAFTIIETLLGNGHEAYLVGGCVRDKQLNRRVKDYDIATSALPERVERLFARTIPTGLQHGTVTVVIDGQPYEVTTFRKEDAYENYRRPTEVQYIDSLVEDLQRRDFTMNAMAIDHEGRLLDPFHGMEDLSNGILRCVGEAGERFQEDALRMLRCVRFAAEYQLSIEERTWAALRDNAPLLKHIAMERVRMELERMMSGASPSLALELLASSQLLQYTKIPLLLAGIHKVTKLNNVSQLNAPIECWVYLYLLLDAEPQSAEEELRQLTFSKQQVDAVKLPLAAAEFMAAGLGSGSIEELERQWKLAIIQYGKDAMITLAHILTVDPAASESKGLKGSAGRILGQQGLHWLEEIPVDKLSGLHISGGEVISRMAVPAGPWVANVLQQLLREAALGSLANEKDVLLDRAERIYKEHYSSGM